MTAPGLVCGPCGTELPPNAKSYNESAVPELPGPVERLVASTCRPLAEVPLTPGPVFPKPATPSPEPLFKPSTPAPLSASFG